MTTTKCTAEYIQRSSEWNRKNKEKRKLYNKKYYSENKEYHKKLYLKKKNALNNKPITV